MQNRDKSNKKLVELLWLEINRAIIDSDDVKATLANLRKLNLLNDIKEYNLVLDINKLIELTSLDKGDVNPPADRMLADVAENYPEDFGFDESSDFAKRKDEPIPEPPNGQYYVDGKPLNKNQILFQEYLDRQFDEEAWLKKARVHFLGI